MSSRTVTVIAVALAVGLIFAIGAYAWTHKPADAMAMFVAGLFGAAMLGVAIKDEMPSSTPPTRPPNDAAHQPGNDGRSAN